MARCREVIHSVREMNGEQTKGRQSVVGAEDERNWVGGQSKKSHTQTRQKKRGNPNKLIAIHAEGNLSE